MKKTSAILTIAVLAISSLLAGSAPAQAYYEDYVDAVPAQSSNLYTFTFQGGVPVALGVAGDGSTDLDCRVYDENGNLIDSDLRYADTCLLEWTPLWSGQFVLEVRNLGPNWNGFLLQVR